MKEVIGTLTCRAGLMRELRQGLRFTLERPGEAIIQWDDEVAAPMAGLGSPGFTAALERVARDRFPVDCVKDGLLDLEPTTPPISASLYAMWQWNVVRERRAAGSLVCVEGPRVALSRRLNWQLSMPGFPIATWHTEVDDVFNLGVPQVGPKVETIASRVAVALGIDDVTRVVVAHQANDAEGRVHWDVYVAPEPPPPPPAGPLPDPATARDLDRFKVILHEARAARKLSRWLAVAEHYMNSDIRAMYEAAVERGEDRDIIGDVEQVMHRALAATEEKA